MVEEQKRRVEDQMKRLVDTLDRTYLRKFQGDMHKCASNCCDNQSYSIQEVHTCIENCSDTLNKAQAYVHNEFERIQNRLHRCVMDCNDNIKDRMDGINQSKDINKFSNEFETCATKCVDSYCDLLPSLERNMKTVLLNKKF